MRAAVLLAALLAAVPAAGDPFYRVRLRELGVTQIDVADLDGVETSYLFTAAGFRSTQVDGAADPAGLAARAETIVAGPQSYGGGAEATMRFEDLVVTNRLDPLDAGTVTARLRFELHGEIALGTSGGPGSPLNANGRLLVSYRLGDVGTSAGEIRLDTDPDVEPVVATGVFAGVADPAHPSGIFTTTADVVLDVGVPQSLMLDLDVIANAGTLVDQANSAIVDLSGVSFPTDRSPVLVLPEGYTADAASASIVDNAFAPEPAGACASAATIAALGAIALVRRASAAETPGRIPCSPPAARWRRFTYQ
jgi:hypothetical protein